MSQTPRVPGDIIIIIIKVICNAQDPLKKAANAGRWGKWGKWGKCPKSTGDGRDDADGCFSHYYGYATAHLERHETRLDHTARVDDCSGQQRSAPVKRRSSIVADWSFSAAHVRNVCEL